MILRRYPTFDEFIIGPGLTLDEGDLVLKTSYPVDARRCARSTFGKGFGVSYVEWFFTSPNYSSGLLSAPPSLAPVGGLPRLLLGICAQQASLSKYLGGDGLGIGWDPYGGHVYNSDVRIATIGSAALGDRVGMVIDMRNGALQFTKFDAPLGDPVFFDTSYLQYFAATVSGNPGDLAITVNAGKTRFWHPYQNLDGFWEPLEQIPQINLATESWMAAATDQRRHEQFEGDIDRKTQPLEIMDSTWFWMWGDSAPDDLRGDGLVQMKINDPNGVYEDLRSDKAKNTIAPIFRVPHTGTFDGNAELLFTGLIDHCDADTRQTKQLALRDMGFRLRRALKRAYYPPGVDPAFAGKPRGSHMGICRNYEGDLVDADNGLYGLHDGGLAAFGRCRAAGLPIFLNIDFNQINDLSGVKTVKALTGKITWESTSFGGTVDPSGIDYLAGTGDFSSAAADGGGHPSGWTGWIYGGLVAGDFQLIGATPHKQVRWHNDPDFVKGFYPNVPRTIKKGRTYAYKLSVDAIPAFGTMLDPVTGVYFDGGPAHFVFGWIQSEMIQFLNFAQIPLTNTGILEGTFTNRTGADQSLAFGFLCNPLINDPGGQEYFIFDLIYLEELPPIADDVEFEGGPGLTEMCKMIVVERGDFDITEVNTADTDLIQSQTGYLYGLGVASNESPLIDDCLTSVLTPSTSGKHFGPDGSLRFLRLFKPEDLDDGLIAGELTADDFTGGLLEYEDLAENLTTRIALRRNFSPIGPSEYGDATADQVALSERALLAEKFQFVKTAQGIQLPARYLDAIDRDPLESTLDREIDGVHAISYGAGLYQVNRSFYVGWAFEVDRTFNLGAVWRTTYDLPALKNGGQKLVIVGRRRQPSRRLAKLYLWGIGKED